MRLPLPSVKRLLMAALLLACAQQALALEFFPSETEWQTWPDYCRARYTVSGAGIDSPFAVRVPKAEVLDWQKRFGDGAWNPLHHYCAGIVLIQRAKQQYTKRERDYILNNALGEFGYVIARIPGTDPFYINVAIQTAKAYQALGDVETAVRYTDMGIQHFPDNAEPYAAKAIIFRDAHNLNRALETLLKGNEATGGKSAEINYFLGLVYMDMNNVDAAKQYGAVAYELGYPLEGLKKKLAAAGRPLN